jgi:hypothetical protein
VGHSEPHSISLNTIFLSLLPLSLSHLSELDDVFHVPDAVREGSLAVATDRLPECPNASAGARFNATKQSKWCENWLSE